MDVQGGVHAGAEFADLVRDKVARCDVLVAIIGPGWSQATDTQGRLRLKLADDLVRVEISSALRAKKRVMPVLVGGAVMPAKEKAVRAIRRVCRMPNSRAHVRGAFARKMCRHASNCPMNSLSRFP